MPQTKNSTAQPASRRTIQPRAFVVSDGAESIVPSSIKPPHQPFALYLPLLPLTQYRVKLNHQQLQLSAAPPH